MPDPYDPGWSPDYTGPNRELGDVGSGRGFGFDLYQLYKAGRMYLPDVARQFHDLTVHVHQTQGPSVAAFSVDGSYERAYQLWMELRDDLQDVFRQSSILLGEVGQALVETANSYVQTDEAATARFNELLEKDYASGVYPDDPVTLPVPPAPQDRTPLPPPPGEEAERS